MSCGMADTSSLKNPNGDINNNRKRKNPSDLDDNDYFEVIDHEEGEIKVVIASGKIISLKVRGSDTIGSLKLKIQAHEDICFDEQELIFNGKVLENINTLGNLRIKKQSVLKLMPNSVELMEIYVNTFSGAIFSLSVKPTHTIKDVKSKIYVKEGIPNDEQVLIFNNIVLGDTGTLFDFHVNRNSTLTLMHKSKGFRGPMIIFIKTLTGEIITQEVKPAYTVESLKARIQDRVNVPADELELLFDQVVLHNINTLADCKINNKSALTLMHKPKGFRGSMCISIKTLTGLSTTFTSVKPSDTIKSLKAKIADMVHVPADEQELMLNQMVLHDSNTLADCQIRNASPLTLMRISRGFMHLFIRTHTGRTIVLDVKPSDTIYNVKSKIHDKELIPVCQQKLIYNERPVENSPTLADYHVPSEATFHLVLRLTQQ